MSPGQGDFARFCSLIHLSAPEKYFNIAPLMFSGCCKIDILYDIIT